MSIGEEQVECPLCMEPLELDDLNFFPCTCGYQICRFCWHRIRTDENGLCPACRKAYPEDPAEFKPLTEDELQRIKRERKVKDLQRKQKAAENRKHLANVRVVQRNLVFVVGLSQRLGEVEVLKKHDYFGKFGKIVKVVINQSTSYAGSQGPSASAYITYHKGEDALRAIQAVNNIHVDGRTLKASLGTTKYCSHFLRGTQCPKGDCMYLHDLGDEQASFTKDEMQQGKHTEYEQKLVENYMNHLNSVNLAAGGATGSAGSGGATGSGTQPTGGTNTQAAATTQPSTGEGKHKGTSRKKSSSPAPTQRQTPPLSASQTPPVQAAGEGGAWPSLQAGPGGTPRGGHTRSGSTDLTQHRQTPDSQRPSPALDSLSTTSSCSSSAGSSQQISPPHTHSPTHTPHSHTPHSHTPHNHTPHSHTPHNHTPNTQAAASTQLSAGAPTTPHTDNSHIHTQAVPVMPRKPLYGAADTDNMSLFSSSGFPVTRNPAKPPVALLAANPPQTHTTQALPDSGTLQSSHPEISDTISVTSSTDWQAAFLRFQPPATQHTHIQPPPGVGPPGSALLNHHMLSGATKTHTESSVGHNAHHDTDDDLGFDPWNESTKALQDLIESESVHTNSHRAQQSLHHTHNNTQNCVPHLPSHGASHHHLVNSDRTKPLPPGFSHNHITGAFNQNSQPASGSRMMSLMNMKPQYTPTDLTNHQQAPASHNNMAAPGMGPSDGDPFSMKSWQEGLRALLPNINIHFGLPGNPGVNTHLHQQLPSHQQQQQQQQLGAAMLAAGHMTPHMQQQQQQQQLHTQQQQQQHTQHQNNWDLFDPAILTSGSVTESLMDEPHWMASLHHLTEEPAGSAPAFLPPHGAPPPPPGFQNHSLRPTPQLTGLTDTHNLMAADAGFQ